MRKTHIEYLKAMVESVEQRGEKLFASKPEQKQGKFLETYPPLDLFQRLIPLCVINAVKCNDSIGNYQLRPKRIENLSPIYDADGNRVFRKLQIHAEQEFTYTLHFIVKDPIQDISSNPPHNAGILDQCKLYILQRPYFQAPVILPKDSITQELSYQVQVDLKQSEIITQYATEGIYILSLDVQFNDKLCSLIEENSIYGSLEFIKPLKVMIH